MPKTLGPERYVVLGRTPRFRRPLPSNVTVCRASELSQCIADVPRRSVFISFQKDATDALLRAGLRAGRRPQFEELITIEPPRAASVPSLLGMFRGIIGTAPAYRWLPAEQFLAVVTGKDAANRFIGGAADLESQTVALVRGNLQTIAVPVSFFEPSGDGVMPDFHALAFTDYGHTVALGDYEASADAILYETDDDYRRALAKERKLSERGFGASLRRLRLQRRLKRSDFPDISPKTIARIERGEVERPHGKTLDAIASRLGVAVDQIDSY